ncbi:MAG: hypothetical protein Q8N31_26105 [Reyranella sp.]|nr:hypothetical protein [Reyranella sp.]
MSIIQTTPRAVIVKINKKAANGTTRGLRDSGLGFGAGGGGIMDGMVPA